MRETGPVNFRLGQTAAEVDAAKPYIGIARTQLWITKNLMQLGGLQQLTRTMRLADGAVIFCRSAGGQDIIEIAPPAAAVAPELALPASVPQAPPAQPAPLAETAEPKREGRKITVSLPDHEGWVRLEDGPPKNGHQAIWDVANARLLVWSGYDRAPVSIATIAHVDAVEHDNATGVIHDGGLGGSVSGSSYTASEVVYTGTGRIDTPVTFTINVGADLYRYSGLPSDAGWTKSSGAPVTTDPSSQGTNFILTAYYDTVVGPAPGFSIFASANYDVVYDPAEVAGQTGGTARYAGAGSGPEGDWLDASFAVIGKWSAGGPVSQLYLGGTPADHDDGFRVDITTQFDGTALSGKIDLLPSNQLWEFTEADGWTSLGVLSYTDWQALVASIGADPLAWGVSDSRSNLWVPDNGDAMYGATVSGYDIDADSYVQYQFGGTTDGTDTAASAQLWRYGFVKGSDVEVDV